MWVACFSYSGSELASVCEKLGMWPDVILTNQKDASKIDKRLTKSETWKNGIFSTAEYINEELYGIKLERPDTLVTLHGYNRIIPEESILKNMFNVHPGDIIKYPELKGKHPQEKALELGLDSTGVIIHRVDTGVDTGEIQLFMDYQIKNHDTLESLIEELRNIAVNLWSMLIKQRNI
jgi:folate-dependent phosphoribosylglycinamide formyltransferase PurN